MVFEAPPFPPINDLELVLRMVREQNLRVFPKIPYLVLMPPARGDYDEIHLEVPEYNKKFKPPVQLCAYALPSEQSHPMTVFGIEELRDVVLFASAQCLIDAGLATRVGLKFTLLAKAGDRFEYSGGVVYEILEWKLSKLFGNSDFPLEFQAIAEKFRPEASDVSSEPDAVDAPPVAEAT